jgi:hypothetical protein
VGDAVAALNSDDLFKMVDLDKSGSIDALEFKGLIDKMKPVMHDQAEKAIRLADKVEKQKRNMHYLFMTLAAMVGFAACLIGAQTALVYVVVDSSKDTEKDCGKSGGCDVLKWKSSGESVKAGAVRAYADLFGLLDFDTKTLSEMETLSLTIEGGYDASYTICGAVKRNAECAHAVTLRTCDAQSITIDGVARKVMAPVNGEMRLVIDASGRRRMTSEGPARLYSEAEFFNERRRLSTAQETSSFAAFALSVGSELIDDAPSTGCTHSDLTVLFSGSMTIDSEAVQIKAFYVPPSTTPNFDYNASSKLRMTFASHKSYLLDYDAQEVYEYDEDDQLTLCRPMAPEESKADAELDFASVTSEVQNSASVYSAANGPVMSIAEASYGVALPADLGGPTLRACIAAEAASFASNASPAPPNTEDLVDTTTTGRRLDEDTENRRALADCSSLEDDDDDCWDWATDYRGADIVTITGEKYYGEAGALSNERSIKDSCSKFEKGAKCARTCCVQSNYYDAGWGGGGFAPRTMYDLTELRPAENAWETEKWTFEGQCTGWDNNTWDRAEPWWEVVGGKPSHAEATFLSRARAGEKKSLVLHFSNMDSVYDMARYIAPSRPIEVASGLKVAEGYWNYISDLEPCLSKKVAEYEAAGKPLSYMVGAGLGGSVASVYASYRKATGNEWPVYGVYSIGAPETHKEGSPVVPGYRFMHETDPIPGVSSYMSGGALKHNIKNVCVKQEAIAQCKKLKKNGKCRKNKYVSLPGEVVSGEVNATSLVTFPIWAESKDLTVKNANQRKWFKKIDKADINSACGQFEASIQTQCRKGIKLINSGGKQQGRDSVAVSTKQDREDFAIGLLFFHSDPAFAKKFQTRTTRAKSFYQQLFPIPFKAKYQKNGMNVDTTWMEQCSVKSCASKKCRRFD